MSTPKKHHYVPVSYLNRFANPDSGYLFVLDLYQKKIRKQKPSEVMHIRNYYKQDWATEGIDKNILEKTFSKWIENGGKIAIDKILNDPSSLTGEDTMTFILYMLIQRIRVPRQASHAKEIAEFVATAYSNKIPSLEKLIKEGRIRVSIKESARFEYMRAMLSKENIALLTRMIWQLVKTPKNEDFITSDSPVTFYNREIPPPSETGLALVGTKVLFPLSPSHLLIMRHPEVDKTQSINYVEKLLFETGEKAFIQFDSIKILTSEGVNGANYALKSLAERFIVSKSKGTLEKLKI